MTVKIKLKDKLEDDTLDLSCCDLEDVPVKEIVHIKKGTHLDLSNNQLVKLPDTFATLSHIVKLDLSKNLLEELPENIGDLKQLKFLDLYSNKISRLPLSFANLKNLKWLDLKDNPLTEVLSRLAGSCSNSKECQRCAALVVSYYNTLKKGIKQQQQEALKAAAVKERKKEAKKRQKKNRAAAKESANMKDDNEKVIVSETESSLVDNDNARDEISQENSQRESIVDNRPEDVPDGLCSTFCRTLIYRTAHLFFWLSTCIIVAILIFTILPKVDRDRSEQLVRYMETQTGLPIDNYQRESVRKLDSFVYYVGYILNQTRILIKDTYHRHFGENELVTEDEAEL